MPVSTLKDKLTHSKTAKIYITDGKDVDYYLSKEELWRTFVHNESTMHPCFSFTRIDKYHPKIKISFKKK